MSNSYAPPFRPADWYDHEPIREWVQPRRPKSPVARRQAAIALYDSRIAKVMASVASPAEIAATGLQLEQRFREQADKWQREAGYFSSVTKRAMHPSYQTIIGMGRDVVPLLLRDLQLNGRDWFWALSAITEENPVNPADAGKLEKMTAAWVAWGRRKRLL
jgi:hypothetical protein